MTKHLVWIAVLVLVLCVGHLNGRHNERRLRTEISHKEDVIKGLRQDKAAMYVFLTAALFQTAGHQMSFDEINNASVIYTSNHRAWADRAFFASLTNSEIQEDLSDNDYHSKHP